MWQSPSRLISFNSGNSQNARSATPQFVFECSICEKVHWSYRNMSGLVYGNFRFTTASLACFALVMAWFAAGCHQTMGSSTTGGADSTKAVVPVPLLNAAFPQTTPTYDGSGEAMHPTIHQFAQPWNGYSFWMAVTPYPNYGVAVEDPSILVSNDGVQWQVPPGLSNPITKGNGQLADPELVYDSASNQMWLYYLRYSDKTTYLERKTSSDGVTWSAPDDVLTVPKNTVLSPTIAKFGDNYYVWSINNPGGSSGQSSTIEYRTSSDGRGWSQPTTASISQPGYVMWHIAAIDADIANPSGGTPDDRLIMLISAYPIGKNSGFDSLFLAESADGGNWTTFSKPVLTASGHGWDHGEIYRSTLLYDQTADLLRVWYSGMDGGSGAAPPYYFHWHTGYTEVRYAGLKAWLSQQ